MPELPEVEHARRQLERHWTGRRVRRLHLVEPTSVRTHLSTSPRDALADAESWAGRWTGATVGPVLRRGKRLGWTVGDQAVLGHLGMTGRWIRRDQEQLRHGRLCLELEGGDRWWLEDTRRFGGISPVHGDLVEALEEGLGPDAWLTPVSGPALAGRLSGRGPVKTQLLDQRKLAGIGNIQAAEALWHAGVHPRTRGCDLSPAQLDGLAAALTWTLTRTLQDAGEGELAYLSQDRIHNPFLVYGRVGSTCKRCSSEIVADRIAGRVSPFCPTCQPSEQIG